MQPRRVEKKVRPRPTGLEFSLNEQAGRGPSPPRTTDDEPNPPGPREATVQSRSLPRVRWEKLMGEDEGWWEGHSDRLRMGVTNQWNNNLHPA
jgi:hypothetical protein